MFPSHSQMMKKYYFPYLCQMLGGWSLVAPAFPFIFCHHFIVCLPPGETLFCSFGLCRRPLEKELATFAKQWYQDSWSSPFLYSQVPWSLLGCCFRNRERDVTVGPDQQQIHRCLLGYGGGLITMNDEQGLLCCLPLSPIL